MSEVPGQSGHAPPAGLPQNRATIQHRRHQGRSVAACDLNVCGFADPLTAAPDYSAAISPFLTIGRDEAKIGGAFVASSRRSSAAEGRSTTLASLIADGPVWANSEVSSRGPTVR